MKVQIENTNCCGCEKCSMICPQHAIDNIYDVKGFVYPHINRNKCNNCGLCFKECSNKKNNIAKNHLINSYAVKNKNEDIRAVSRSGGMFYELAKNIINKNGNVYGCTLINNETAKHICVSKIEDIYLLSGSKYIQSSVYSVFNDVKNDLLNNKWVLFSGTPCQVNAIKSYCREINTDKLVLVDIICHGVPSQRVWKDYLKYISKKHKKEIERVDFRDKKHFGWAQHFETFYFKDGSILSLDIFKKMFFSHFVVRESCFNCQFKSIDRIGDITLGDCWGIEKNDLLFNDNKGVSLVLVNSKKGNELFSLVKNNINYIKIDINNYIQESLKENYEMPHKYNKFWQYYSKHSFQKSVNKYIDKENVVKQLLKRLKFFVFRIVKG